jgi:hypothetical protein
MKLYKAVTCYGFVKKLRAKWKERERERCRDRGGLRR